MWWVGASSVALGVVVLPLKSAVAEKSVEDAMMVGCLVGVGVLEM